MAVPTQEQKNRSNKAKLIYKQNHTNITSCKKQFPDCPVEPNDDFCKTCPHYKTLVKK